MKSPHKTPLLLLGLVFVCLASCTPAYASTVSFEGGAENLVFNTDSSAFTNTDLFDGLKNALPGETLSQTIQIGSNAVEYDTVRIFLRAVPHDEEENPLSPEVAEMETLVSMKDFLSQLTMQIYNNGKLIYSASADQLDNFMENIPLGEFHKGESTLLTIELTVPLSLDNKYAHRTGEIDWVFTAEGDPVSSPNTGGLFGATGGAVQGICIAVVLVAVCLALRRSFMLRRKRSTQTK